MGQYIGTYAEYLKNGGTASEADYYAANPTAPRAPTSSSINLLPGGVDPNKVYYGTPDTTNTAEFEQTAQQLFNQGYTYNKAADYWDRGGDDQDMSMWTAGK